jgi:hypothetical protein
MLARGRSNRRYLWIHGDERTAGAVLAEHMKSHNGVALLVDNPTREVHHGTMKFDPNRMFSDGGLRRNLERLNPGSTEAERKRILAMVARDRQKLIRTLTPPRGGLLIALHNNARGYSVHDEVEVSNDSLIREPESPGDFVIVTSRDDFERIQASPFNALLQNRPGGEDDGSMSRVAAARGFRYINIEVAIGRSDKQKAILDWLEANLP